MIADVHDGYISVGRTALELAASALPFFRQRRVLNRHTDTSHPLTLTWPMTWRSESRVQSASEAFECNRRFWDVIFEKAERPIFWEMFRKLDDRMTRYHPLLVVELYPTPESRPRQHEALIESIEKARSPKRSGLLRKSTWRWLMT